MAPTIPQFPCPWSTVQCYCQLWLRTQEGHHLVSRCLSQMPLQGDLATAVVAFGISRVNMCWHCLSPTHARTHKTPVFWQGTFFTMLWLGILNSELASGILTSLCCCYCLVFMVDASQFWKFGNWQTNCCFSHKDSKMVCKSMNTTLHKHTHTIWPTVADPSSPS